MSRRNILDLSFPELEETLGSLGESTYRARQVSRWLYRRLAVSFEDMTDSPLPLRQKLSGMFTISCLKPLREAISGDGQTRKLLFMLSDGKTIESCLMVYPEAMRERRTVCVSTQVGCTTGCPFCATGQQGFERNLSPGEIIEQVLYFLREDSTPVHLPNIVFMGMGEPLANYDAVMKSIIMLNSKNGLGLGIRQITVSTAGLVPQINRLSRESLHVELSVSLHAASNALRNRLVPINKKYPLEQLIPACRDYLARTGRRPTFEYALFKDINDSMDDARKLAYLLKDFNCHVNLIAGNPTPNCEFMPPPDNQVRLFSQHLKKADIANTIRLPKGADINAGCGQLRSLIGSLQQISS